VVLTLSLPKPLVSPRRAFLNRLEKPLAILLISLGLTVAALSHQPAHGAGVVAESTRVATVSSLTISQMLPNGVYLYGQSPEAMQLGSEYMVFEVNQDQVVGAFYMPQSSFDCFVGEIGSRRLSLNIFDSYDQSVHPYAIALDVNSSVATNGSGSGAEMGLEGFHRISDVSELDQSLLNTCRADHL